MRSKLKMREELFLFASAGLAIASFLPLCRNDFQYGELLNSETYMFIDSKIGLLVPIISIICFFVAAFNHKTRIVMFVQLVNTVAFVAGGAFYVNYLSNDAASQAAAITQLASVSGAPSVTFTILFGIYVAAAMALFILVTSIVCLLDKDRR